MKSKSLKKIKLNKRSISTLSQEAATGGTLSVNHTTTFRTITVCSSCCANTIDDHTCGYCTIA
jgi:hypothetical protein